MVYLKQVVGVQAQTGLVNCRLGVVAQEKCHATCRGEILSDYHCCIDYTAPILTNCH